MLLIGWRKFSANQKHCPLVRSRHQNGISALVCQTSFRGKPVVASRNVGCFLTLTCSRPSDSRERREVKNARKNERDWRELFSLFLCLRRFHFFFLPPFLLGVSQIRPASVSFFGSGCTDIHSILVCYTAVFRVVTQRSCGEERCVTTLKTAV